MAESLFFYNIAEEVIKKLGSLALQEIGLAWGVSRELNNLEDTITTIKAVLLDAEEQQEKDSEVRVWLGRLKDVCHSANDVLDDFEVVALRRQLMQGSFVKKVRNFFSSSNPLAFRFRMGHKIREIRERLDEIANDKAKFHLTRLHVNTRVVNRERETFSFLHYSDAIGRDQDKEDVIDLLMDNDRQGRVGVIPIVGIGGLGKTTLTKMVYNDERVSRHFHPQIWISVSEDFNVKKLIGKIVESASGRSCNDLDMEAVQIQLRETLKDKRFLLVLDDVWNDKRVKWVEFMNFLTGGARGSKTIVTTRSHLVASIVGTISPYNLEGLPHEDCLSLLLSWAFKEGEEMQYVDLMRIGEEIVKKCKGVPLAVRTLGSLLYTKREKHDWLAIKDNEIWRINQKEGDILPALRLSYDELPSYLKQCFSYCSIFPKEQEIMSVLLIYHWMAHGLIQLSDQSQEPEKIGEQYIHDLASRSFFHDVEDYGCFLSLKMHDLVHDLALSVAQTEHWTIDFHAQNIPKKIRHLSFCDVDPFPEEEVPSSLLELENVRTIYFQFKEPAPTRSVVDICVWRFRRLRVLDLNNSRFEELPSSICGLKHLRFLNLFENKSIKSLPNSLCKLQSLQTVTLGHCVGLERLPGHFENLVSLRVLWLTTQERCLSGKGIERSTSLRILLISECHNLQYLFDDRIIVKRSFTALRTLTIANCERLVSLPRGLRFLTALENLSIINCENLNLGMDEEKEEIIHGGGDDLKALRYLWIGGLPKLVALPHWLLKGAATTLNQIWLWDCLNFTTLPENLKSLHKLWICGCPQLKSLPEGMNRFTTLREIRIARCPELIRRCQSETGEDWKKISHVSEVYLNDVKIQNSIDMLFLDETKLFRFGRVKYFEKIGESLH